MKGLHLVLLLVLVIYVPNADAFTQEEAKVALHLAPHARKGQCLDPDQGGVAPVEIPCSQFRTQGGLGQAHDLYLVVVADEDGISGLTCGIDYDPAPNRGVDVFGWELCSFADISQPGPNGDWPAAESGNRIIWDFRVCERNTVPGFEEEGVHAIAGAFYLYAYSDDVFEVTTNFGTVFPEFGVTDCGVLESGLPPSAAGRAVFSGGGVAPGDCNPCLEPCAEDPVCSVSATSLDFGVVPLKEHVERRLDVTNVQGGLMVGFIQFRECDIIESFLVYRLLNPPRYAINAGESASWKIRFLSAIPGEHRCVLDTGPLCPNVEIVAVAEGGAVSTEPTSWGSLKMKDWGGNIKDP